jgi:hypothetical protein
MICESVGIVEGYVHPLTLPRISGAGCALGKDGDFVVTTGMQFGLFVGLLIVHGFLKCVFRLKPNPVDRAHLACYAAL